MMSVSALVGVILSFVALHPSQTTHPPSHLATQPPSYLTTQPPAVPQDVKSDQEILVELERRWDAAFHSHDAAFIETVLADEFIATYGDGSRGDKAKELSLARESNQQVDSSRLDDFIIKVYRDTAVVWFTQYLVGPVQGRPTEVRYQYMDVWVIRDGRWQCVASQSTRLGMR